MKSEQSRNDLDLNSLKLNAFPEYLSQVRQNEHNAKGLNPWFVLPALSARTSRRVRNQVVPVVVNARARSQARIDALSHIENAISFAAICANLEEIDPELHFSMDSVSFLLGSEKNKPIQVCMTEEAAAKLSETKLQPGTKDKKEQLRVVSVLATISAGGSLTHAGVVIKDREIASASVSKISDSLSVWMLPVAYDTKKFFSRYLSDFLFPAIATVRASILGGESFCVPVVLSPRVIRADARAANKDKDENEVEFNLVDDGVEDLTLLRSALHFDGEHPQLQACLEENILQLAADINLEFIKSAAACSLTQSANDYSTVHSTSKQFIRSSKECSRVDENVRGSHVMETFIRQTFDNSSIPTKSKNVFRWFLRLVENMFSKGFPRPAIQNGFASTGIKPFSTVKIMSGFSGWANLDESYAKIILDAITNDFKNVALSKGCVPDVFIRSLLAHKGIDISLFPERGGLPLEEMALNRRRALWLNNKQFRESEGRRRILQLVLEEERHYELYAKFVEREAKRLVAISQPQAAKKRTGKRKTTPRKAAQEGAVALLSCCNIAECNALCPAASESSIEWRKCSVSSACRIFCCPEPDCFEVLLSHQKKTCRFRS